MGRLFRQRRRLASSLCREENSDALLDGTGASSGEVCPAAPFSCTFRRRLRREFCSVRFPAGEEMQLYAEQNSFFSIPFIIDAGEILVNR